MTMSDEDSEYDAQFSQVFERFKDIFKSFKDPSDLGVELLSVIKSYPTHECAIALGRSVLNHTQASLQDIDSVVVAFKNLIETDYVKSILVTSDGGVSDPFEDVCIWTLCEHLSDLLHETQLHVPKQTVISAGNPTLSAALFSASAIKNRLDCVGGSSTLAFVRQGLQLPKAEEEEERKEVLALGACLQLSVAGATIMEGWLLGSSDSQEAVVLALKGLKERGVITTSGGLHLLDVSNLTTFFSYHNLAKFTLLQFLVEND